MRYFKFFASVFFYTLILLFIFPSKIYAYIDPGTGSYIFQMILGVVLGGLFAAGIFWRKIKAFFKNLFSKKK